MNLTETTLTLEGLPDQEFMDKLEQFPEYGKLYGAESQALLEKLENLTPSLHVDEEAEFLRTIDCFRTYPESENQLRNPVSGFLF